MNRMPSDGEKVIYWNMVLSDIGIAVLYLDEIRRAVLVGDDHLAQACLGIVEVRCKIVRECLRRSGKALGSARRSLAAVVLELEAIGKRRTRATSLRQMAKTMARLAMQNHALADLWAEMTVNDGLRAQMIHPLDIRQAIIDARAEQEIN